MACIITYKGVEYTEELFEKMLVRQRFPELASYLPTQDEQLRIVDANWSIRLTDKESWGLYKDGIIYVESDEHGNVRENVLRHEVFHKIFNQYLTGPQRDAMYALKRAELGDLPFIDLEEAMAQSYQTFKIPLLRRFISFTAANLNTLEGMYEAFDKGSFSSERSKFFGERNALKIKKDFATVRNFNEAERRFFQVFKSLMTYDPKSNDRVFTFEEALDEVFRVIENDVENLKKTLTSTAQGTQAYSYAFKLMSVSNLVLLNKKSMLEHFFKGWDQSKIKARERERLGQLKLQKALNDETLSDVEKEEAQETYNTLRNETLQSLEVDPTTALTARVKYRLAELSYQSSRSNTERVPFHKSFAILLKSMSQADTSSLDSILNHITRRLSKYSKAVALPQSPHEAVLQMLENLKTLIEIGEAPGISFRRDVSKKALYVEYPNREPSEQLTGETLDDFINRIATSKENRADLIKSYRYFDAVVTMTSMSSAISALRPYRMWGSMMKFDQASRQMVLKLFRAKESGAKAVEASDFYAKISKRIEDGLNPFSNTELIDGVNVNLWTVSQKNRSSIDNAIKAVDSFLGSYELLRAGTVITHEEYKNLAQQLAFAERDFESRKEDKKTLESAKKDAGTALGKIVDALSDYSEIPEITSFRTGDGSKRFTYTMSTYQHSLLYSLAEMANGIRGILPSSLRWKEVSKDKFFIESDAYFTSKSIYLGEKPLVKIKDYVDWDSQQFHGNKKPVNYLDESRAEYWQRTYVTGMLESLGGRQGVYTHFLPVPSNRPNATAIQVEAKSVQWIKENILPVILAHEQGRPALDVKDYNQKRLNLPSLDSNGKVVPNAADATLDDIIRAFDAEVVRVKQALRDADLKVEALELLESNLVSIASKGLIQYESKMPKDLKEEIPKRAEAEYYAAMEEKGVPKAKAEALLEESGADLYEEIYNKITTEYNNYETGSKSEKNAKLAELRDSILDAGVELFVYNYIINQHQATQLLYADPAFFPTGAILTKRIQLPTSSGTVPLINPKSGGLDTKSTVLVLKEVKVHLELKEVYEKMVKLPANSPIRKQLESLDPKDPLKWADSQGFTHPDYYKQLNVSFSPEAGLDVVQKFMYYSVDEKGIPRTLKFSSITLTDELCASFPYFKTIRDSMDEYNKDTTRPPIGFATFQSSVKLAAPSGATIADEFSGNFVIDENSTFQIHNQFLRMPLNPASEPLGSTMAPGQGNYLINANQLNSEETAILYDHIDTIIDMADKLASKDFQLSDKGKPTRKTLSIIRKLVIKAVSGLDAGQLEESLLEAQNKSGYSVSSSLPLIKNRVVKSLLVRASKTVTRYRLRGSKLVLMSEFGSFVKNIPGLKQRQDNLLYKDENGFTEVIMPDTFRGLYTEGQLLGFRIPSTHLHSFVAIKVVGFYPVPEGAQGNVVITPSMIQFTSGAD